MILKILIEASARGFIVVFLLGMIWTVYSNHNPDVLENLFILRIVAITLGIWVLLPFLELKDVVGNKGKSK